MEKFNSIVGTTEKAIGDKEREEGAGGNKDDITGRHNIVG